MNGLGFGGAWGRLGCIVVLAASFGIADSTAMKVEAVLVSESQLLEGGGHGQVGSFEDGSCALALVGDVFVRLHNGEEFLQLFDRSGVRFGHGLGWGLWGGRGGGWGGGGGGGGAGLVGTVALCQPNWRSGESMANCWNSGGRSVKGVEADACSTMSRAVSWGDWVTWMGPSWCQLEAVRLWEKNSCARVTRLQRMNGPFL